MGYGIKHTVLIRRNTNCQYIFPKSNLNPYWSGKWKLKLLWDSLLPNQNGYQWEKKGQQTLWVCGKAPGLLTVGRSANWCATVESRVEGSQKAKIRITTWHSFGACTKGCYVQPQRRLCILVHYCSIHNSQEMEPVEAHQYEWILKTDSYRQQDFIQW